MSREPRSFRVPSVCTVGQANQLSQPRMEQDRKNKMRGAAGPEMMDNEIVDHCELRTQTLSFEDLAVNHVVSSHIPDCRR